MLVSTRMSPVHLVCFLVRHPSECTVSTVQKPFANQSLVDVVYIHPPTPQHPLTLACTGMPEIDVPCMSKKSYASKLAPHTDHVTIHRNILLLLLLLLRNNIKVTLSHQRRCRGTEQN